MLHDTGCKSSAGKKSELTSQTNLSTESHLIDAACAHDSMVVMSCVRHSLVGMSVCEAAFCERSTYFIEAVLTSAAQEKSSQ